MFTFMTFGTPHLGCKGNSSFLVNAGMKLLQKIKKHDSLKQMALDDGKDLMDSYIYKLSTYEGLNWFKHVVFTSSYQDYYSPFHSSRCEYGS